MQIPRSKPPIRWLNLAVLGIPVLVAVTLVPWYGFTYGYAAYEWVWFFGMLTFCELSITAGYHRLWSHGAYKAHPILKFVYALGGACALQNDCLTWAADHRRHHLHADDNEKDPYSAHLGFWYAHFGWMLRDYPSTREDYSNVKDLLKEPILVWQRKHYLALLLIMNVGVPVYVGWLYGDIWGGVLMLGFLRLVVSQHFTYLINSAAHMWGQRTYDPAQTARDNWFIALFTFGEGYHNYHHTFAWDYRNGVKWYHYDPTKWFIKACSWFKLASDLRFCSSYRVEMTRIGVQYKSALGKCERLIEQGHWRDRLEHEYEQLVATLNAWSDAQQKWYHARSRELSDELHHDMDVLKASYVQLKAQLQQQRANWHEFHTSFGRLAFQST